jgi:outer membrane protein assembly factor BamB
VAEKVWENTTEGMYMSSPVVAGTAIYGLSHRNRGHFFAVDVETGKTLWATRGREAENAAVVAGGNLLFVLQDDAELIVARANPRSFDAVRRYTVADSATWAHPIVDGNRIFVRDATTLRMWTIQ